MPSRLLGQDRVGGVAGSDSLDDECLAGVVDVGDDVSLALAIDLQDLLVAARQHLAGAPGERHRELEVAVVEVGHRVGS